MNKVEVYEQAKKVVLELIKLDKMVKDMPFGIIRRDVHDACDTLMLVAQELETDDAKPETVPPFDSEIFYRRVRALVEELHSGASRSNVYGPLSKALVDLERALPHLAQYALESK